MKKELCVLVLLMCLSTQVFAMASVKWIKGKLVGDDSELIKCTAYVTKTAPNINDPDYNKVVVPRNHACNCYSKTGDKSVCSDADKDWYEANKVKF